MISSIVFLNSKVARHGCVALNGTAESVKSCLYDLRYLHSSDFRQGIDDLTFMFLSYDNYEKMPPTLLSYFLVVVKPHPTLYPTPQQGIAGFVTVVAVTT